MLEVRSLEKSFGSKQVLFGIDFQARPGRILGLVGKNGAGKTTIFHSILKFLEYQGEISLDGQDIRQETYARIGYLPEERSLMPKLTVLEQVRYLATLKGMDAKEVKEKLPQWMKKLEVKGKLTDKIKSLSKGNQQKIQLIITLIHEPDLIILDAVSYTHLSLLSRCLRKRVGWNYPRKLLLCNESKAICALLRP